MKAVELVLVCGNKYSFRSLLVPVLRQVEGSQAVRLLLLDFPESYGILPVLDELQRQGVLRSFQMIPDSHHASWRHHRALAAAKRSLCELAPDLLVVTEDSAPMFQYLIHPLRRHGVPVVALQTVVPIQLIAAYEKAVGTTPAAPAGLSPALWTRSGREAFFAKMVWSFGRWQRIRGRIRALGLSVKGKVKGWFLLWLNYRILPLFFLGRFLDPPPPGGRALSEFVSGKVDGAIVYSDKVKEALKLFFPRMNVWVARHPLSDRCRCSLAAPSSKVLLTFGGPWVNSISLVNSAQEIESRWCRAILEAARVRGFTRVEIRPHPREAGPYPDRLAKRLSLAGIPADVLDCNKATLPEIICEYAGLIGAPSGALTEAAVSCRRAFVVGLEGVERPASAKPARHYSESIRIKPVEAAWREEDFLRPSASVLERPTVREILEGLALK